MMEVHGGYRTTDEQRGDSMITAILVGITTASFIGGILGALLGQWIVNLKEAEDEE